MPITTQSFEYPFDPNGQLESNFIQGEQHVFNGTVGLTYQKVVPRWAPFFSNSLRVTFIAPGGAARELVMGMDYYLGHRFISATRSTGQPIYGSINILDRTLQGTIVLEYRHLGGAWSLDEVAVAEILADQLYNPRIITWEAVVDLPFQFPVTEHEYDIVDMKGTNDLTEALYRIVEAMESQSETGLQDHIANTSNPHGVTKSHVGLGNVQNFPLASTGSAAIGSSQTEYMTPYLTREAIRSQVLETLQLHMGDFDNPHDVTPAIIGAVALDAYVQDMAQKLGVGEAAADAQMFNGMSLAQLTAAILEGTAANAVRMNGMTYQSLMDSILSGTAANALKLDGMSVSELQSSILTLIGGMDELPVTAVDTARFDGKTFPEAMAAILAGDASNALRFEGYTLEEVEIRLQNYIGSLTYLNLRVNNSDHFGGRTYQEVYDDILAGDAANALRLGGYTLEEVESRIVNTIHDPIAGGVIAVDSEKLEGRTFDQVRSEVLAGTASNALRFEGKTFDEAKQEIVEAMIDPGAGGIMAADTEKFEGRTFVEAREEILGGIAADTYRFAGMEITDFPAYMIGIMEDLALLNATVNNALHLEGRDYNQIRSDILSGTSADSALFSGMTPADMDQRVIDLLTAMPELPVTASDSALLQGYTFEQILTQAAIAASEADSNTLNGMTTVDIFQYIEEYGTANSATLINGMSVDQLIDAAIDFADKEAMFPHNLAFTFQPLDVDDPYYYASMGHGAVEVSMKNPADPLDTPVPDLTEPPGHQGFNRAIVQIERNDLAHGLLGRGQWELLYNHDKLYVFESFNSLPDPVEFSNASVGLQKEYVDGDLVRSKDAREFFVRTKGYSRVNITYYGGYYEPDNDWVPYQDLTHAYSEGVIVGVVSQAEGGSGSGSGPNKSKYTERFDTDSETFVNIRADQYDVIKCNVKGNKEIAFTDIPASIQSGQNAQVMTLILSRSEDDAFVTFDEAIQWENGIAPEITLDSTDEYVLTFLLTKDGIKGFMSGEALRAP